MKAFLSDMDGVVYRGNRLIPGAVDFVRRLQEGGFPFLFLTNNSEQTPLDLQRRLAGMGIDGLGEENFITSAMATAAFLHAQRPGGTAFVIGGSGLANELYKIGFSLTEKEPDYVVVGKTRHYNYEMIEKAVRLVAGGARFIATNPDMVDPTEHGLEPACGSLLAPIEQATGRRAYVVGKPNALMMLIARRRLGSRTQDTVMIGDRMDTDIVAGMEAGMTTALVLSGVTTSAMLEDFPWRPDHVFADLGEIDPAAL